MVSMWTRGAEFVDNNWVNQQGLGGSQHSYSIVCSDYSYIYGCGDVVRERGKDGDYLSLGVRV